MSHTQLFNLVQPCLAAVIDPGLWGGVLYSHMPCCMSHDTFHVVCDRYSIPEFGVGMFGAREATQRQIYTGDFKAAALTEWVTVSLLPLIEVPSSLRSAPARPPARARAHTHSIQILAPSSTPA